MDSVAVLPASGALAKYVDTKQGNVKK